MGNMTKQTLRYGKNRARQFHNQQLNWLSWNRKTGIPTMRASLFIVKG